MLKHVAVVRSGNPKSMSDCEQVQEWVHLTHSPKLRKGPTSNDYHLLFSVQGDLQIVHWVKATPSRNKDRRSLELRNSKTAEHLSLVWVELN